DPRRDHPHPEPGRRRQRGHQDQDDGLTRGGRAASVRDRARRGGALFPGDRRVRAAGKVQAAEPAREVATRGRGLRLPPFFETHCDRHAATAMLLQDEVGISGAHEGGILRRALCAEDSYTYTYLILRRSHALACERLEGWPQV